MLQEPPAGPVNVSYCCHLLRLYGLESFRHPRFASGRDVVGVLTDQKVSESILGEPIFFQTRSGIRYRDPGIQKIATGENHRDICLATFAELGLPLSTPMTAVEGSFTLRELLRDSVASFDLKQEELGWTAVAYALYLTPQGRWRNRDGESFTFDDLANALMQARLGQASCGGAHLLYAMTVLWRADASEACLSASVREALTQHLRQQTTAAMRALANEGYWTPNWHVRLKPGSATRLARDNDDMRFTVTGHLLEWLEMVPVELQPPPDVYRRVARWLCATLGGSVSGKTRSDFYCPFVHAVCGVRRLVGELGD
jgi:hypothetical protein